MKFVGVSTGRAGSVYIAALFNLVGIPTLHEYVFNGDRLVHGKPVWGLRPEVGEWSAQAVPFLHLYDVTVFHQVRHPLNVIGSYLGFGLFHHPETFGAQGKVITDRFRIDTSDPLRSAVRFYLDWNRRCELHADMRWRVEDVDEQLLQTVGDMLGMDVEADGALSQVPADVNSRGNAQTVTWDDLSGVPEAAQLQVMARRYGYVGGSDGSHRPADTG